MIFGIDAFNGILLYPNREIGTEKSCPRYIRLSASAYPHLKRTVFPVFQRVTHVSLDQLAVDRNAEPIGLQSDSILAGIGIVDIFPVMRQITERKDKRGCHRIVGGVAEGVLSRDLPCIGEEFFGTAIIIFGNS